MQTISILCLKYTTPFNSYKTLFPRKLRLYYKLLYFCKVKLLYFIKVVMTILDGLRSDKKYCKSSRKINQKCIILTYQEIISSHSFPKIELYWHLNIVLSFLFSKLHFPPSVPYSGFSSSCLQNTAQFQQESRQTRGQTSSQGMKKNKHCKTAIVNQHEIYVYSIK